ncbi:MAG: CRISPR-associated helicase/endonuclease Cas3 [Desulfatirhabdiaceae bacterium]
MSDLIPGYFRYWGKAKSEETGEPKWHPLVYHSLDVASVAAAWWDSNPVIHRIFRTVTNIEILDNRQLRAIVLFFLSLHDIGKFDIRFQLKVPDILDQCWPEFDPEDVDCSDTKGYNHGLTGYLLTSEEYQEWFSKDTEFYVFHPWIAAVTGHHGELPDISSIHCRTYPAGEDYVLHHDREARCQFVHAMMQLFLEPVGISLSILPFIHDRAFSLLLAGFCSISDWIGSNVDAFPYQEIRRSPVEYFADQYEQNMQKQLLARFGLIRSSLPYSGIQSLIGKGYSPRGIQRVIDDLPVEPGLTIVEAPTGSGKTEAALAYAWRLLDGALADSIVFALPTQATANAMLTRIQLFAEKLFGVKGGNVVLAHGKRDFNHEFQRLVAAGCHAKMSGEDDASVQCAEWLAQSRKRVFLGQIGICTVDQVLLSVLPVRHKFVRSYGLSKSVIIVDEVHAYDSYMHGLLTGVIRQQQHTGGSIILLSATLSATLRNQIIDSWDGDETTVNSYPLITQVMEGKPVRFYEPAPKDMPPKRDIRIDCLTLPDAMPNAELLSRIIKAAESGCRVAVIVNMVKNAQAIARDLRDPAINPTSITVDIFHSRYRFLDRQNKEMLVLDEYGLEAKRDKGRILVATQVVEQSLDLDFDWMVTQICPIDLLFQRIGRLHRHNRHRPPGFELPCCTIMTVENHDYKLHKDIYGNARVLWRTEQLAKNCENNLFSFPGAYRDMIDSVYESNDWDEPENIIGEYFAYSQIQHSNADRARQLTTMTMKQFRDDNDNITSLTRDGEMSLTIVPIVRGGAFLDGDQLSDNDKKRIAELINLNGTPVPASWKKYLTDCSKDDAGRFIIEFTSNGDNVWISTAGKTQFIYTKDFGLEKE